MLLGNGSFLLVFATRRYTQDAIQKHNQFSLSRRGTLEAVFITAVGTMTSLALMARVEYLAAEKETKN